MWASFNRFELQMTMTQAQSASHQGECINDVEVLLQDPRIKRQFKKIDPKAIRIELQEYGAWDDNELADDIENQKRILWIAACDIVENVHESEVSLERRDT